MYSKKMQYVIKAVPVDDKQALENLLNDMSEEGWDLYTMHEVETDSSVDFNCIFVRERKEELSDDLDDIVSITSFKNRMEKMLAAPSSPYASCKEIQLKIANQKERIKKIKDQLESETLSPDSKNKLNNQMSDELKQLDSLKQLLVNEISPDTMYTTIKEEKFVVNINGKEHEFPIARNFFQKEYKIDISRHIEDGENTIVFHAPSLGRTVTLYVELVEKYGRFEHQDN